MTRSTNPTKTSVNFLEDVSLASKTPKEDLKALLDLTKSRGWQVFTNILKTQIFQSSLFMSDPNNIKPGDLAHLDFQRGMIHCASKIEEMVSRQIAQLDAQVKLQDLSTRDPIDNYHKD